MQRQICGFIASSVLTFLLRGQTKCKNVFHESRPVDLFLAVLYYLPSTFTVLRTGLTY